MRIASLHKRDFGEMPVLRSALFVLLLAAPVSAQTIQQDYEAAQKALDARDVAGARARFEALLKRMPPDSRSRSMGVVKSRLGAALVMDGEQEAAIPLLTEAMAIFDKDTPADVTERTEALADRARAHEALGQFADAAADYRAALNLLKPEPGTPSAILLQTSMGRALIWSDANEARRVLDGLIALPDATWGEDKRSIALVHTLRGRVELNDGKPQEAMRHFRKAMVLAGGGHTRSVDLTDVRVRADAAIAAYLLGQTDEQQKYVAFSGGGSVVTVGLTVATSSDLPPCGASTGLSADDVAVVEFAIGSDGRVRSAQPIYVKRADGTRPDGRGGPEAQFVQAVRNWYWKPSALKDVDPFWRQASRVELRCSTGRPESNLVRSSIGRDLGHEWTRLRIAPLPDLPDNDAAALPLARAELQRRISESGPQSLQLVAPLLALASNGAAAEEERAGWIDRALGLLEAADAGPETLAYVRERSIRYRAYLAKNPDAVLRERMAQLVAAEAAARPYARTTQYFRLELAEALQRSAEAERLLNAIVATPLENLPRADPIRTAALLRLSNIAAARKDLASAAQALAATGLTPEQCALVDVRPQVQNRQVSSSIFPPGAHRWGSGGLTKVEYDIGTDGKPQNPRTVMAAPPFVFGRATEKGTLQLRYQPVFRPGNSVGCTGMTQNFRFMVKPL